MFNTSIFRSQRYVQFIKRLEEDLSKKNGRKDKGCKSKVLRRTKTGLRRGYQQDYESSFGASETRSPRTGGKNVEKKKKGIWRITNHITSRGKTVMGQTIVDFGKVKSSIWTTPLRSKASKKIGQRRGRDRFQKSAVRRGIPFVRCLRCSLKWSKLIGWKRRENVKFPKQEPIR